MTTYQTGDQGDAVKQIQNALTGQGHDPGSADGVFGSKTQAAVEAYQKANGLTVDGQVGPQTWTKLIGDTAADKEQDSAPTSTSTSTPTSTPTPAPTSAPAGGSSDLRLRCVGLTGSFETSTPVPQCYSGLTGNFDGQGMSFGALQQCLGQGSLQPLLKRMISEHQSVIAAIFGDDFEELQSMLAMTAVSDQVAWAASKQTAKYNFVAPWSTYFTDLGKTAEYQAIQGDASAAVYERGLDACRRFGLVTERAAALMFDIMTQNGSISDTVADQIFADFKDPTKVPPGSDESAKLVVVANRRAEASKAAYVEDVRTRKLTIANGTGTVHGMKYDLATGYNIRLVPATDLQ